MSSPSKYNLEAKYTTAAQADHRMQVVTNELIPVYSVFRRPAWYTILLHIVYFDNSSSSLVKALTVRMLEKDSSATVVILPLAACIVFWTTRIHLEYSIVKATLGIIKAKVMPVIFRLMNSIMMTDAMMKSKQRASNEKLLLIAPCTTWTSEFKRETIVAK